MKALPTLLAAILAAVVPAQADLYVSNFHDLNVPTGATGVWRNQTTATDLAIPVEISQSGGTVRPDDGSSTQSRVNDNFPWQALPAIVGGANAFNPNFDGDYINIETREGNTATVTLKFNAMITDPVISFTDVDYRSTITFPSPFVVQASTSNLLSTATTLTSDRTPASGDIIPLYGDEAAGSIRITGTFSEIVFTVAVGIGDDGVGPNDRTGYVISTMTEPVPLTGGATPVLSVTRDGDNIQLDWPIGEFSEIQVSAPTPSGVSGWSAIPDLDPGAVGTWSDAIADLGSRRFFRGIYP